MKKILVTGGCGFIGSHFIITQIKKGNFVVNIDKLTYASNIDNVDVVRNDKNYHFIKGDICDRELIFKTLLEFEIDWLVNFAAESHVDNSISGAEIFIKTNINGTFSLLGAACEYHKNSTHDFRFLHVSTDEVYGSLKENEVKFNEESRYKPNSPYSASKAASDHLVRAWFKTYGLPTIITNCSNNFGPNQHPEKLIPTIIGKALREQDIPIYGNGKNIRDWIYVLDHCYGIELALIKGKVGEVYCFGGEAEKTNLEVAEMICEILDEVKPKADKTSYKKQIKFVTDRAGHDFRYAIDNSKVRRELGFVIEKNFKEMLKKTVMFYITRFNSD